MLTSRRIHLATVACVAASALAFPADAKPAFQVIYNFTGGADGGAPPYTLVSDGKKGFLGTASFGGANGNGLVFQLVQKKSKWNIRPLYNFADQDGEPGWGLVRAGGSLYTNATYASVMGGPCGSALQLNHASGGWSSVLMRTYVKSQDGCPTGNLYVDRTGNVFGVTQSGGSIGWGSIFELSYAKGSWSEKILYSFTGGSDGGAPYSELVADAAGNLYGTASAKGAAGWGTVFELSPNGSDWTYNVIHTFEGSSDGGQPVAALTFDKSGNLFGASTSSGPKGGGTVFELTPSGANWNFSLLASMTGSDGPVAALTLDAKGNIYGTNFMDGTAAYGSVFSLTPGAKGWKYKDLHDFTSGSDGGYPGGGVTLDANGNLFGTAVLGGANNFGVIYEIAK
ncbi:MAG TPA: choice-of-anchor tandem repeat GloVer-containing protein [Rhizomicrobium sp.]